MNVVVTGAAGYVGSICAEALVARGCKVTGLDNLVEGHRQAVPREAVFWECDLGDRKLLDEFFASQRIDAVMHFAAEALVEKSVRDPSPSYVTNVACGLNLLDVMVRHGVKNLIFSSTAAVYGESEQVPIPEEHRKAPTNPYGRSKLIFEQILEDYRASTGLRYMTLRYFNAAGASEERGEDHHNETHLIPRLLEVASGQRKQVEVNGNDYSTPDGTCVRDYVHVLDIAARRPIPAVVTARRPGDPAVLVASSDKIRRELGWAPRLSSLESIVATAWAWKQRFPAGYGGEAGRPQASRAISPSA